MVGGCVDYSVVRAGSDRRSCEEVGAYFKVFVRHLRDIKYMFLASARGLGVPRRRLWRKKTSARHGSVPGLQASDNVDGPLKLLIMGNQGLTRNAAIGLNSPAL